MQPFLDHFTREDGEFIWQDEWGGGSPDDFYEPFFNWPLVYLMGGDEHLLHLADRQWEAITRQLTRLGSVSKEYGICEDQMHQAESDVCFYNLCLAHPNATRRVERACRFAGFYLNEDPEAQNYDPEHKILRSGLNGSHGPYFAPLAERDKQSYNPLGGSMEVYNLPFFDLPGITSVQDLADPAKARLMGQTLFDRWRQGDTPTNLAVTSLVTNAFLITGDEKYRAWVVEYTDAWVERAQANGGMLPDNVGLSGEVGEYCAGNWYGGRYGWTFPHGFLTLQKATLDAAANAYLLTRDRAYLDLPRQQMDRILEQGRMEDIRDQYMSVAERWGEPICRYGGEKRDLVGALPLRRRWLVRLAAHESGVPGDAVESVYGRGGLGAHGGEFGKKKRSIGPRCSPSTTKRTRATRPLGCASWPGPTRPIQSIYCRPRTKWLAAAWPNCASIKMWAPATTSTTGNGAIQSLPKRSFNSLWAAHNPSTTAACYTPACATLTPSAAAPACPKMSALWWKSSKQTAQSCAWSI